MKRHLWMIFSLSTIGLLAACSETPENNPPQAIAPSPVASQPQSFPNPAVSPTKVVEVPAVPGLIRPTNARARVPGLAAGRPDPFAALSTPPLQVSTVRSSKQARPNRLPSLPSRLPTVPLPSSPPLSSLPALNPSQLPALPLPAAPAPVSIPDAIEVTGALQVGNQWNVIVKEPNASTSRYVKVGDYLANGQVLVKRVIVGSGDPTVVLQHNGREILKSVGSANTIASNPG